MQNNVKKIMQNCISYDGPNVRVAGYWKGGREGEGALRRDFGLGPDVCLGLDITEVFTRARE